MLSVNPDKITFRRICLVCRELNEPVTFLPDNFSRHQGRINIQRKLSCAK